MSDNDRLPPPNHGRPGMPPSSNQRGGGPPNRHGPPGPTPLVGRPPSGFSAAVAAALPTHSGYPPSLVKYTERALRMKNNLGPGSPRYEEVTHSELREWLKVLAATGEMWSKVRDSKRELVLVFYLVKSCQCLMTTEIQSEVHVRYAKVYHVQTRCRSY
jgi:hypothetical protein